MPSNLNYPVNFAVTVQRLKGLLKEERWKLVAAYGQGFKQPLHQHYFLFLACEIEIDSSSGSLCLYGFSSATLKLGYFSAYFLFFCYQFCCPLKTVEDLRTENIYERKNTTSQLLSAEVRYLKLLFCTTLNLPLSFRVRS